MCSWYPFFLSSAELVKCLEEKNKLKEEDEGGFICFFCILFSSQWEGTLPHSSKPGRGEIHTSQLSQTLPRSAQTCISPFRPYYPTFLFSSLISVMTIPSLSKSLSNPKKTVSISRTVGSYELRCNFVWSSYPRGLGPKQVFALPNPYAILIGGIFR